MTLSREVLNRFLGVSRRSENGLGASLSCHSPNSKHSSNQFGVKCDLGVEDLGNRTVLLGITRHPGECGLVQVWHVGAQRQSRTCNAEALPFRFERDGRFGAELGGRVAAALQLKGQSHRKAASMRGSDQLFGVSAFLIFKAGPEGIRSFSEHSRICGKTAVAGAASATPNSFCFADHGTLLC